MILNLLSNTSTANGLTIYARLDTKSYPLGVKVSKTVFASLNIEPNRCHGDLRKRPDDPTSKDRRHFAFGKANELWMSDLMHSPAVTLGSHSNSRSTGRSIADNHRIAATQSHLSDTRPLEGPTLR